MQHEYSVHIYWDEAENIFVATGPELVECTASGATHEEALTAVHEAIEDWIASAKSARHPIPAPQGDPTKKVVAKGRGGRRQERNEQRRQERERGRHERRQSS